MNDETSCISAFQSRALSVLKISTACSRIDFRIHTTDLATISHDVQVQIDGMFVFCQGELEMLSASRL